MNIAIVAPSPVPFCVGGAENLWWGLLSHVNQQTSHHADLIKIPTPETNFWELIDSYRRFSELDLSHFDLVISTKYPAWMVDHPNHVCYLQHRLRGLYDTYHFCGKPLIYEPDHPELISLQHFMQESRGARSSLASFFEQIGHLRGRLDLPSETFEYPGPFIREVIHYLDAAALAPGSIRQFAAISQNVKDRLDYFPEGCPVEVIHHPSNLTGFKHGGDDYLFTVSRLDGAKRIELLIEAMRHVRSDIELRIAGSGPDGERLRELAGGDSRIRFLGFVNDREVVDLYADALAVPYVPYDEDYGLVTIEAMMSGKPMLTTLDAGGPNEFIRNGETGFSTPAEPAAIAERIDFLCSNRDQARAMGERGYGIATEITWDSTVTRLLKLAEEHVIRPVGQVRRGKRPKMTVALSFPVVPVRGGGQARVFHLYRQLATEFDIELITFTEYDQPAFDEVIAPGLREIRLPKSAEHHQAEAELSERVSVGLDEWVPITDVAMPLLYARSSGYVEALRRSAADADVLVACHPYLFPALKDLGERPIWYEAHNVELDLKAKIVPDSSAGRDLLDLLAKVERECCEKSQLITVCSTNDGRAFQWLYDINPAKVIEAPNGVDLDSISYARPDRRRMNKRAAGVDGSFIALFMGSWHEPNLNAVRSILKFAEDLPDVHFLIVGSAGLAFDRQSVPGNVGLMGVVEDDVKNTLLGIADIGLNPMTAGSGTNLKMLDYCAAGIPVITTPQGARGLDLHHGRHLEIVELDEFPQAIGTLRWNWDSLDSRIETAREQVAARYGWSKIGRELLAAFEEHSLTRPERQLTGVA